MILLFLLVAVASAQTTSALVLHARGTPQEAFERVREALGPTGEATPLSEQRLTDQLSGPPTVLGGGSVERCPAPSQSTYVPGRDAADIAALVADQRQHIATDNLDKALMAGRQAIKKLPCSRDPLPQALLRDLYFKEGIAAGRQAWLSPTGPGSYADEARAAFTAWRVMVPDDQAALTATGGLTEQDGQLIAMSVVKRKTLSASMRVVPQVHDLWIDGSKVSPKDSPYLSIGRHFVQIRATEDAPVESMWVQLGASGQNVLAVPALIPTDALDWVEDADRRQDLTDLLRAFGSGTVYVVTSDDAVWRGELGDPESWTSLTQGAPALSGIASAARITGWTGVGITAASAVVMGTGCMVGRRNIAPEDEPYVSNLQCGGQVVGAGYTTFQAARGALVTGLVLTNAGLGLAFSSREIHLGLVMVPGGALAAVSFTPQARPVTR